MDWNWTPWIGVGAIVISLIPFWIVLFLNESERKKKEIFPNRSDRNEKPLTIPLFLLKTLVYLLAQNVYVGTFLEIQKLWGLPEWLKWIIIGFPILCVCGAIAASDDKSKEKSEKENKGQNKDKEVIKQTKNLQT